MPLIVYGFGILALVILILVSIFARKEMTSVC
jgi:hypothetical protein